MLLTFDGSRTPVIRRMSPDNSLCYFAKLANASFLNGGQKVRSTVSWSLSTEERRNGKANSMALLDAYMRGVDADAAKGGAGLDNYTWYPDLPPGPLSAPAEQATCSR